MSTIVNSRGIGSQNWIKCGPRSCWMTPKMKGGETNIKTNLWKIFFMIFNQYQEIPANNLQDNKFCLVSDDNKLSWSSRIGWIFYPRDMNLCGLHFFLQWMHTKILYSKHKITILMIVGFNSLKRTTHLSWQININNIFWHITNCLGKRML